MGDEVARNAARQHEHGHRIIVGDLAEEPFELRIGIHTGPVVAGVIGSAKFAYDLWGDTVNTASRMASNCLPGRIQVSEATHDLLRARYRLESRGTIEVKGKGEIKTYFLEAPR